MRDALADDSTERLNASPGGSPNASLREDSPVRSRSLRQSPVRLPQTGLPGAMPVPDQIPDEVVEEAASATELQGAIKAVEALLEMPGGAAQIQTILIQQKMEAEAQSRGAQ